MSTEKVFITRRFSFPGCGCQAERTERAEPMACSYPSLPSSRRGVETFIDTTQEREREASSTAT
ncbi:hypothetical protein OUZ56_001756 [Daphnia magna]|uniref:Uncharacterized protein n=1 Tax=Daphnia magna TaxID=35525 RepID=A0ABR0A446_9CRUS|nr:hypothetical protein OUZ56_001756 [Daphnia magna]